MLMTAIFFIRGLAHSHKLIIALALWFLLVALYILSHVALFGSGAISGDLGTLLRVALVILVFYSGYVFVMKGFNPGAVSVAISVVLIFSLLLAIDYYLNGLTRFQQAYVHRGYGARFAGTYGWPHVFGLFLFLSATMSWYSFKTSNGACRIYWVFSGVAAVVLGLATGSRGVLLSFALSVIILMFLFMLKAVKSKAALRETIKLPFFLGLLAVFIFVVHEQVIAFQRMVSFEQVADARMLQIDYAIGVLGNEWRNWLFGLGSNIFSEGTVESGIYYIYRYGIAGTFLIVLPIFIYTLLRTLKVFFTKAIWTSAERRVRAFYYFNIAIFLNIVFSFGMAAAFRPHLNNRYLFIMVFLFGMHKAIMDGVLQTKRFGYRTGLPAYGKRGAG